jgi:hypothetical protein
MRVTMELASMRQLVTGIGSGGVSNARCEGETLRASGQSGKSVPFKPARRSSGESLFIVVDGGPRRGLRLSLGISLSPAVWRNLENRANGNHYCERRQ